MAPPAQQPRTSEGAVSIEAKTKGHAAELPDPVYEATDVHVTVTTGDEAALCRGMTHCFAGILVI